MSYKQIVGVLALAIFLAFISSGFAGAALALVTFIYQGFLAWLQTQKQQRDFDNETRMRKMEEVLSAMHLDVR